MPPLSAGSAARPSSAGLGEQPVPRARCGRCSRTGRAVELDARRRSGAGRPRRSRRAAGTPTEESVIWSFSSTRPCTTCTSTSSGDRSPRDTKARTSSGAADLRCVADAGGLDVVDPHVRPGRAHPVPSRPPARARPRSRRPATAAERHGRGVEPEHVVADHPAGQHLAARGSAACAAPSRSSAIGMPVDVAVVEQRRHGASRAGRRARRPRGRRGGPGRSTPSAVGIAQPLCPSYISSHQPSSTDRLRQPLRAAFMPDVPQASSGRSGLLSQTSQPG